MEIDRVVNRDCLEGMREMEENSVDAIVTDPPYGLSFMGQDWDHGVPGVPYWQEALRVAKPGAHLLACGGPRTHHRLMVAIEDAGWELRDCCMWIYGCLSEDTEVLTDQGWERYHKNILSSHVLSYDLASGEFAFEKPAQVFNYKNEYPAYHIVSDSTDQIVSRNHRCIVERAGMDHFIWAEALEREESVPFLESLSDLPDAIPYLHQGTSLSKQDLLSRVQQQESLSPDDWTQNPPRKETDGKNCLPRVRDYSLQTLMLGEKSENPHLQQELQWDLEGVRMEGSCPQRTGGVETRIGCCTQGTHDWAYQPFVEGGGNNFQKPRELWGCDIYEVPRRIFTHGSERRVRDGAPSDTGETSQPVLNPVGGCPPYRSRSYKQRFGEPYAIQNKQGPQIIRRTTAKVQKIEYSGEVWCIQISSGAFVARRKGKIFITGNSGFPKSLNLGKAIDKAAGVEREVVGERSNVFNRPITRGWDKSKGLKDKGPFETSSGKVVVVTAPATDAAKQWDGWGTALKPSYEPVVLARKPLDGTVAGTVLKWGCGGINIDGCRIGTSRPPTNPNPNKFKKWKEQDGRQRSPSNNPDLGTSKGRWPANLLIDEVAASLLDQQSGTLKSGANPARRGSAEFKNCYGEFKGQESCTVHRGANSGGASRFFYCSKAPKNERCGSLHPTVKPLDLMRYLCRLVTPPGGLILDPFLGSGTTAVAAVHEGFHYLGFEINPSYCADAERRIAEARREIAAPRPNKRGNSASKDAPQATTLAAFGTEET